MKIDLNEVEAQHERDAATAIEAIQVLEHLRDKYGYTNNCISTEGHNRGFYNDFVDFLSNRYKGLLDQWNLYQNGVGLNEE